MILDWWHRYADDSRGQLLEFLLHGIVSIKSNQATYYYEPANGIGVCTITKDGIESNEIIPIHRNNWSAGLPYSDWFIMEDFSDLLVLGKNSDLALDNTTMSFVTPQLLHLVKSCPTKTTK